MLDKVPELRAMTMVIRRHQRCMSARQLLVVNCADLSLLICQTSGLPPAVLISVLTMHDSCSML